MQGRFPARMRSACEALSRRVWARELDYGLTKYIEIL